MPRSIDIVKFNRSSNVERTVVNILVYFFLVCVGKEGEIERARDRMPGNPNIYGMGGR